MPLVQEGRARRARSQSDERSALAAAYREGLGVACITIICDGGGTRIVPGEYKLGAEHEIQARWWCRRAEDAERVASQAAERLRRRLTSEGTRSLGALATKDSLSPACDAVLAAAQRLNIALRSDDELAEEALLVAARVDAEMQKLQQSGGLKSVNKAYRDYRLTAAERGERAMRYDDWMRKYRENLVRQAACALRDV